MQDIIVFGAGKCGKIALKALQNNFGDIVKAVIDNTSFGFTIDDVPVLSASDFLESDSRYHYVFITSGKYCDAMFRQLIDSQIDSQRVFTLEHFLVKTLTPPALPKQLSGNRKTVILGCTTGFVLGGVSQWISELASGLKERNLNAVVCVGTNQIPVPVEFLNHQIMMPFNIFGYHDIYTHMNVFIKKLEEYGQITFILSHIDVFSVYCLLFKKRIAPRIKIISVVHSSLPNVMFENLQIEKYIDQFVCVNYSVWKELSLILGEDRVLFKEIPIVYPGIQRTYHMEMDTPLKLGYASRLDYEDKRADLIIPLIKALEKKRVNYELEIAGEGDCLDKIREFISQNRMNKKIRLLGKIPHQDIFEFWSGRDIAVSVSETEGCSLSMLESMACGCINVTTRTAGIEYFIQNHENGYVVESGDIAALADRIEYLSQRKGLLNAMGTKAQKTILDKCGKDAYLDFFEKII